MNTYEDYYTFENGGGGVMKRCLSFVTVALTFWIFAGCVSRQPRLVSVELPPVISPTTLNKTVIPEVDLRDATFYDLAEMLQYRLSEVTGRKITVTADDKFYGIEITESVTNEIVRFSVGRLAEYLSDYTESVKQNRVTVEARHVQFDHVIDVCSIILDCDITFNITGDNITLFLQPKGLVLYFDPEGFELVEHHYGFGSETVWKWQQSRINNGNGDLPVYYLPSRVLNNNADKGCWVVATPEIYALLENRRDELNEDLSVWKSQNVSTDFIKFAENLENELRDKFGCEIRVVAYGYFCVFRPSKTCGASEFFIVFQTDG